MITARLRTLLAALLVVAVLVGGGLALARTLGGAPAAAPSEEPITVVVGEGMDASAVAELLAEKGVIGNTFAFKLRARFDGRASQIRPGTYEFRPGTSTDAILAALSAAPEAAPTFRVTIPEGLQLGETLQRIADAEGSPFTRRELTRALRKVALPEWVPGDLPAEADRFEGLLFPSTYEFLRDAEAEDVLARLVQQTEEVMAGVEPPAGVEPYEVLTMASLIEREARLPQEQPKIASVIYNRLEEGIALQIDATVLYALGEQKDRVLLEDLEVESPWNTYRQPGLPPTPISGAGQTAIEAAADPADTDFLYYVVVNPETGKHAFSETYDEFLANKRKAQGG